MSSHSCPIEGQTPHLSPQRSPRSGGSSPSELNVAWSHKALRDDGESELYSLVYVKTIVPLWRGHRDGRWDAEDLA